ncbi:MAG: ABC transporter substrate-binding protein [Parabacteroides sp.]|nr:ABC transporter substrate-binding protein [Parabacteroides sp.]
MTLRLCFLLLLLCSCAETKKNDTSTLEVCILRGPSAIALASLTDDTTTLKGYTLSVKLLDSPEQMQARLIKHEADIAVLPMTAAANLYNKGTGYRLAGCPVWGTLYIVGHDSAIQEPTALFGAGTTPDILARYYWETHGLPVTRNTFTYAYPSARETLLALLNRRSQTAVLSEPFVSMALKKDTTLRIVADLNRPEGAGYGFPQTAVIIRPELNGLLPAIDSLLHVSARQAMEYPEKTIRLLERQGVFAPGMLSAEGIRRCRLAYRPATDIRDEVYRFLDLVYRYEPRAVGNRLPDATFIPERP